MLRTECGFLFTALKGETEAATVYYLIAGVTSPEDREFLSTMTVLCPRESPREQQR